jgi:hypothetical protein
LKRLNNLQKKLFICSNFTKEVFGIVMKQTMGFNYFSYFEAPFRFEKMKITSADKLDKWTSKILTHGNLSVLAELFNNKKMAVFGTHLNKHLLGFNGWN